MNTPTPITAAHLALVRDMAAQGQYLSRSIEHYAQEIADSEARATAELRGALALGQQNCDDVYDDLRTERDQLRAEVERLKAVPPTASCGELSCDECNARTAALKARAERAEAEVERLRSDRDCEKRLRKDAEELREDAIERADRAEAELAALRQAIDEAMNEDAK